MCEKEGASSSLFFQTIVSGCATPLLLNNLIKRACELWTLVSVRDLISELAVCINNHCATLSKHNVHFRSRFSFDLFAYKNLKRRGGRLTGKEAPLVDPSARGLTFISQR